MNGPAQAWTALTILPGRAAAEALAEAAEALDPAPVGAGVFEIEDGSDRWEVGLYYTDPPDEIALLLIAAAGGAQPFVVSELPETDWVAQVRRILSPVAAGRFWLHGSHDAHRVPAGVEPLLIEASMAFGTGHHETTRGCLIALDRLAADGFVPQRAADIGAGTAVLAMAAARLWPGIVVQAGDIDPVAVETATVNIAANGLTGRVAVVEAAGFGHPALEAGGPYDLILANILKGPLVALAPEMGRRLAPGGRAILAGLLTGQAEAVIAAHDAAGVSLERREDHGDWAVLTLRRK